MVSARRALSLSAVVGLAVAGLALGSCSAEDGGTGRACTSHLDCGETGLCVQSSCRSAFVLTLETALAASYGEDGMPWDPPGAGKAAEPDLFATVQVDGVEVCRTPTVADSADPQWRHACPVQLGAGSEVRFEVTDVDDAAEADGDPGSDQMYLKYVSGAELELGRSGSQYQDFRGMLVFELTLP